MKATRENIENQVSRFLKLCNKWTLNIQGFQIAEYNGTDKDESLKQFNEALNTIEQDYQNETIELKFGDANTNGNFKKVQTLQFVIDKDNYNSNNVNLFNPQNTNNQIFSLAGINNNNGQNQPLNNVQVLQGLIDAGISRTREEIRAESAKQIAEMQAQFILKSAEMQAFSIIENAKRDSERILAEALKREEEIEKREEELEVKLEELEEKSDEWKQGGKAALGSLFDFVKEKVGMTDLKGINKKTGPGEDVEEELDKSIETKPFTDDSITIEKIEKLGTIEKQIETKAIPPAKENLDLDAILSKMNKEEAQLLGYALLDKFPEIEENF